MLIITATPVNINLVVCLVDVIVYFLFFLPLVSLTVVLDLEDLSLALTIKPLLTSFIKCKVKTKKALHVTKTTKTKITEIRYSASATRRQIEVRILQFIILFAALIIMLSEVTEVIIWTLYAQVLYVLCALK